jgi:prepilin-type N-terminal cleavage/methylation domain-containing protein
MVTGRRGGSSFDVRHGAFAAPVNGGFLPPYVAPVRLMPRPFRSPRGTLVSASRRRGFTLLELMVVIIIVGVVTAIALPKIYTIRDKAAVRSARQQAQSYLMLARATAIRKSQYAWMRVSGQTISVYTPSPAGGTTVTRMGGTIFFNSTKVTMAGEPAFASPDSIMYDLRGMASNRAATQKITFTRNSARDSLCVSRLGLVVAACTF